MSELFSRRHGYRLAHAEITTRETAPQNLRSAVPLIAKNLDMKAESMRRIVCQMLLVEPKDTNIADIYIWNEVKKLFLECTWFEVYDIAEALYDAFLQNDLNLTIGLSLTDGSVVAEKYSQRLNQFFYENGIGWEMRSGEIQFRGSDTFNESTKEAAIVLMKSGFSTAETEIREAIKDLSRRPDPDLTGSIQHGMAALEAVARFVTGKSNFTLGRLISKLNLPQPLDNAVKQLWNYASEHARHVREGRTVDSVDAELLVIVSCALCTFIAKQHQLQQNQSEINTDATG